MGGCPCISGATGGAIPMSGGIMPISGCGPKGGCGTKGVISGIGGFCTLGLAERGASIIALISLMSICEPYFN